MPSPSSTQSVPHTPLPFLHQKRVHDYRQTMYHNKAGVQIAECRRRAGVARSVEPSTQPYVDFVLYPMDSMHPLSQTHSHSSRCAGPKVEREKSSSKLHVTFAKHSSSSRPKPAIMQRAPEPRRILPGGDKSSFYLSGEPTPPPTPRLRRLSTPELPELEEAPFCDCGTRGHIVKRCRTCGREVDLLSA